MDYAEKIVKSIIGEPKERNNKTLTKKVYSEDDDDDDCSSKND